MFSLRAIPRLLRPRGYYYRSLFIQTETTPNDNSLKFKPGKTLLKGNKTYEFSSPGDTIKSPLVGKLFELEGVQSVFVGSDFITVTKTTECSWPQLKPLVFEKLMDHFSVDSNDVVKEDIIDPASDDPEVVQMIKELLDTRIRPVVNNDGGDVQFVKFEDGNLHLRLQGACKTCSSSEITLKQGIERMIVHYIPEVKKVIQAEDELQELNKKVFEDLEQK